MKTFNFIHRFTPILIALACLVVGLINQRFGEDAAIFAGWASIALIFAINGIALGFDLQNDLKWLEECGYRKDSRPLIEKVVGR